MYSNRPVLLSLFFPLFNARPCECELVIGKINLSQPAEYCFIKLFFADRCRRTVRRAFEGPVMATIVDVAFLPLRDERVVAASAADDPAIRENMTRGSVYALACEHRLSRFEYLCRDQWFVIAFKRLASLLDRHQTDIELVFEHRDEAIDRDRPAAMIAEAATEHLRRQIRQRKSS